jgi:hypothetical protein
VTKSRGKFPEWKRDRIFSMLLKGLSFEDCAEILGVPIEVIRKQVESVEREFDEMLKEMGEERFKATLLERIQKAARAGDPGARAWLKERNLLNSGQKPHLR